MKTCQISEHMCEYSNFAFRVDPHPTSRPLLPEEMDSIRRILSRNLQRFNTKVLSFNMI